MTRPRDTPRGRALGIALTVVLSVAILGSQWVEHRGGWDDAFRDRSGAAHAARAAEPPSRTRFEADVSAFADTVGAAFGRSAKVRVLASRSDCAQRDVQVDADYDLRCEHSGTVVVTSAEASLRTELAALDTLLGASWLPESGRVHDALAIYLDPPDGYGLGRPSVGYQRGADFLLVTWSQEDGRSVVPGVPGLGPGRYGVAFTLTREYFRG